MSGNLRSLVWAAAQTTKNKTAKKAATVRLNINEISSVRLQGQDDESVLEQYTLEKFNGFTGPGEHRTTNFVAFSSNGCYSFGGHFGLFL
jgi:hypothetical protein